MPLFGETNMGSKNRRKARDFESSSYDDYDDDLDNGFDDDLKDLGSLSKDFYSTDWEDPSGSERRFSTRRKIERRNDLRELYSQFDEWDDFDIGNEW